MAWSVWAQDPTHAHEYTAMTWLLFQPVGKCSSCFENTVLPLCRFHFEPFVQLPVGRDAPMTPLNVTIASAADTNHIKPAQPQVCSLPQQQAASV